jgi:hypothetical protein
MSGEKSILEKLKPAAPRHWLMGIAGVMWSAVGVLLCGLAVYWLVNAQIAWEWDVSLELIGVAAAIAVYSFGFSRIARKNIERLCSLSDRPCLFAFQAWKSYLLIGFMMALGITLRHSAVPKHYLAVVYTTIGGALFCGSFQYYGHLRRGVTGAREERD